VGLDDAAGSVVVHSLDGLALAATTLLADPDRLARLAGAGRAAATAQVDWDAYVARVAAALDTVGAGPVDREAATARAAIGGHVSAALGDRQARARFLEHRTAALEADVDRGLVEIERLSAEVERLIAAQEERIVGLTGVRRRPEEDSDGR